MPGEPLLSSRSAGWNGLLLEQHRRAENGERSGTIDGYHVCLNLSGPVSLTWKAEGRTVNRTLSPRDVSIATNGELRREAWREAYDLVLLSISPHIMSEIAGHLNSGRAIELEPGYGLHDPQIAGMCTLLVNDVRSESPAGRIYGEQLGAALALYLARRHGLREGGSPGRESKLPRSVVKRVCDLIEARLETPLGLEDLAREAGLSRFYFARLFRASTGRSPYQYLTERRIERAREMLSDPRNTFEHIAAATGFASHSHFSLVFRRVTGFTPRQARPSGCAETEDREGPFGSK